MAAVMPSVPVAMAAGPSRAGGIAGTQHPQPASLLAQGVAAEQAMLCQDA